jgi:hypothetical protein
MKILPRELAHKVNCFPVVEAFLMLCVARVVHVMELVMIGSNIIGVVLNPRILAPSILPNIGRSKHRLIRRIWKSLVSKAAEQVTPFKQGSGRR